MSNEESRNRCLVRVIRPRDNKWVGTGFCLPQAEGSGAGLIMTCAHVVADALDNRELAMEAQPPVGECAIDFVNASNARLKAHVLRDVRAWHPMMVDPAAGRDPQDIAVLELTVGLPVAPVVMTRRPPPLNDEVTAFGSPSPHTDAAADFGNWSQGRCLGENRDFIEFQSFDPKETRFIIGGCSGAPLWSTGFDAAVGMVTLAYKNEKKIAYATPTHELERAWPPIAKARAGNQNLTQAGALDAGFFFIDRTLQSEDFVDVVEGLFGKEAQQSLSKKSVICAIIGDYRQAHDAMLSRFGLVPIARRHKLASPIAAAVEWPYGLGRSRGLGRLRKRLQKSLNADGADDPDLIAAINRSTGLLHTYVGVGLQFGDLDAELMQEWIAMWERIGTANPGLKNEFYVFLSFQYCPDRDAGTRIARFCEDQLPALMPAEHDHKVLLKPLRSVAPDEIDVWCDRTLAENGFQLTRDVFGLKNDVKNLFAGAKEIAMSNLLDQVRAKGLRI